MGLSPAWRWNKALTTKHTKHTKECIVPNEDFIDILVHRHSSEHDLRGEPRDKRLPGKPGAGEIDDQAIGPHNFQPAQSVAEFIRFPDNFRLARFTRPWASDSG
jgi:hypothetical protein